jgi:glutaminyl-peptide cyclotransferase
MRCVWLACLGIASAATPEFTYKVVHVYPHDPSAYTQGLEFRAGFLYEGTGLEGRSSLSKIELETGKVLQRIQLDPVYFGEGITLIDQRILELTWRSQRGFVYDQPSLRLLRTFEYPG